MECIGCGESLSLQNIDKNFWREDTEVFVLNCPICDVKTEITSELFEDGHISKQYLAMVVSDTQYSKTTSNEKLLDYLPELQKQKILEHVSMCQICADQLEEIRLKEFSKEIIFNEKTYKFFISRAKNIIRQLDLQKKQVVLSESGIKSFVFDETEYELQEENLFCKRSEMVEQIPLNRYCYNISKESIFVGMVSFVISNNKIILEKIWLKSDEHIEKEKEFLKNLKNGKVKILFNILDKLNQALLL